MARREHLPETVWKAQELFCVGRMTYSAVAKECGISASTAKRWGKKYGWATKRENIAKAECELRADMICARSEMLKQLIQSKDAQTGFAVASLESLALKQAEAERAGQIVERKLLAPRVTIESRADAIKALQQAVEMKLSELLTNPIQLDLKAVREVRDSLAFIETMRAEVGDSTRKQTRKGLSSETVQQIEKMLGYE